MTSDVQVFPDNERFHSTKLKSLERILDTKAVFAGILTDLVEVLLNELLFLDELDVGQRLRGEFNSL